MKLFGKWRKELIPRPPGLLGPDVPLEFKDNGCGVLGTRILDMRGRYAWCGRIHDYEYSLIRMMRVESPPPAQEEMDAARYAADANFKYNLKWMSKGWLGVIIARLYFRAVRTGGALFD